MSDRSAVRLLVWIVLNLISLGFITGGYFLLEHWGVPAWVSMVAALLYGAGFLFAIPPTRLMRP